MRESTAGRHNRVEAPRLLRPSQAPRPPAAPPPRLPRLPAAPPARSPARPPRLTLTQSTPCGRGPGVPWARRGVVAARERLEVAAQVPPEWSKAVKSAALEAASASTRGSGWAPSGSASPWECRAARSRQARPEEAQEPSWGAAKGLL